MNKKGTGILFLILGFAGLVAAVMLLISGIFKMTRGFEDLSVVQSPGEVAVQIGEAQAYTLWHDYRTMHDGSTVLNPPALPGGFTFILVRDSDGVEFALDPTRSNSRISSPKRDAVEVGTFAPSMPGPYTLRVSCTGAEARIFSLSEGNILGGMAQFGLRTVLACLLGFLGLVLLILGIVFMLLKPKAKPPPSPLQG